MTRRGVEIALLAGGLAVLAALAYGGHAAQEPPARSVYSTYDTGPNGYRAAFDVLAAAGVPVRRFARALGRLDRGIRTLILSTAANDPAGKAFDSQDADRLRNFVRGGGRLVVLDSQFAGRRDVTPGIGTSVGIRATGAIAMAHNRYTAGVVRVRGPIDAAFAFRTKRGVPLLANDRGLIALSYRYGNGEVVAITAPALFGNASLRDADNLRFAYDVVAGHGPAAFDEYVHGYDDDVGLWQVLPGSVRVALGIVCAIVGLALIGANVPFAPPIPAEPPDERDTAAYVDAMAALLQRARAAHAAIGVFSADAVRRSGLRPGSEARDGVAELERLAALPQPSDAALLRAASIAFRLRKDRP